MMMRDMHVAAGQKQGVPSKSNPADEASRGLVAEVALKFNARAMEVTVGGHCLRVICLLGIGGGWWPA
eukprot:5768880-Amphidinium_carterae.2